jgi:uncharacterized protein YbaR (Trm112 family)
VKSAVKSAEPGKTIQAAMTAPQSTIDSAVLAQLACPACHGDLHAEDSRLVCSACARRYPIVDGIPALIIERAESAAP